ncbi:hypothetical protein [Spirosoma linguale]|uniref:Uncharacterized protein n=1 Tax=Spirosoma linguale (strain ATCC 33905 / DSM 74 / LMG 10896 / Claus 1) TaxID=504472 RepID=D2QHJ4_SPILD|nr:hypothetical protein Slin_2638 [Spirosoma linguale DSM 74]
MKNAPYIQRSPNNGPEGETSSSYEPERSESLKETEQSVTPVTSSPGEKPYTGSHADNYEPDQSADRNVPEDGPSGENTKNGGKQGGGLWTSGGIVTTGTPFHEEPNKTKD